MWNLEVENRKIRSNDVIMRQLKRTVKCIEVSDAKPIDVNLKKISII